MVIICPICHKSTWSVFAPRAAHRCAPTFVVHYPDHHGDDPAEGDEVHAVDAEDAGREWIENDCDSESHASLLDDGGGWLVTVTEKATGTVSRVRVFAEQSIDFTADLESEET